MRHAPIVLSLLALASCTPSGVTGPKKSAAPPPAYAFVKADSAFSVYTPVDVFGDHEWITTTYLTNKGGPGGYVIFVETATSPWLARETCNTAVDSVSAGWSGAVVTKGKCGTGQPATILVGSFGPDSAGSYEITDSIPVVIRPFAGSS